MTTRSTDEPTTTTDSPRVGIPISADDARGAIDAVGRAAPDVARSSRDAVIDTMRWIETGSDDRVATGATLSLGLAIGLVLGGASRFLIALALLPVTAFGMVLLERRRRARTGS